VAMEEIDLIDSKHCQTVSRNGKTVKVEIYGTGKNDWILEVVDEYGNSTVWDDPFPTDEAALDEPGSCINSALFFRETAPIPRELPVR